MGALLEDAMMEKAKIPALAGKSIAVLGGTGNLGSLLAKKLAQAQVARVVATGRDAQKLQALEMDGVQASMGNAQAVREADIVLLCVKPQQMKDVVREIMGFAAGKLFVSVAAGVPLSYLERELAGASVVRCMPNLCAKIGMSQTAVATNSKNGEGKIVREMLALLGETYEVQERQFAVWTAVSGSGPAFLVKAAQACMEDAQMLSCMRAALCREGFGEGEAAQIGAQVLAATKELMQKSNESGEEFIARVCSKKGTTEAGLQAGGNMETEVELSAAFEAAKMRAMEIEAEFG